MKTKSARTIAKLALLTLVAAIGLGGCIIVVGWLDTTTDLTIELTWNDASTDLDLYVTYPGSGFTIGTSTEPTYTDILDAYDASAPEPNIGFFPEDEIDNPGDRDYVNQDVTASADDNLRYRRPSSQVEVIDVYDIPFSYGTLGYKSSHTTANALPDGYNFAWIGVMEVYVYGQNGTVSDAGNAEVKIYDQDDNLIASAELNEDTYIKGASVFRIPVFRSETGTRRNYYQILLDKTLMRDTGGIRSLAPADSDYFVTGSFGQGVE